MKPDRGTTFMEIAAVLAKRSTCQRGQVGAVIVKDRRIVASGYNGSAPNQPECIDVGCDVPELYQWNEARDQYLEVMVGCQRAIHAEANAIAWAARHGLAVAGATMYCTHGPCLTCAKLMASAGIAHSIFSVPYRDSSGLVLLTSLGIDYTIRELPHETKTNPQL